MVTEKRALTKAVRSCRLINKLAEVLINILPSQNGDTLASYASDYLLDAFSTLTGETFEEDDDFLEDSEVEKLIKDESLSDKDVATIFLRMYEENKCKQPEPKFIDRKQMAEQYKQNGGYISPEGDWT